MSGCKEESLSPDEMRQKRYQTFKSRGLLDALKTELKQKMEAFDKTCKLHEEKVKTMDDLLLLRRERSVKTSEDTFDQKLKSELVKYQLELKEDYAENRETDRKQEETSRLQKESAIIDAKAEEHERSLSEVKRLLSPNKEASENHSQEESLQSEKNDRSVDLMSHDEPDDDFW